MKSLLVSVTFALSSLSAAAALAQDYPSKPINLVVPYPAGGGADIHARLVGQKLTSLLGQSVIIENRSGASGNIGAAYVAKAEPDGYTLLLATSNLVINPAVSPNQPFDVLKDFTPISTTLTAQNLILVNPAVPVQSFQELIDYAKANPGKLNYGSSGVGTPLLAMEMVKSLANLDIVQVPYKGDNPALADLLGGQIQIYAGNIAAVESHHRSGKLRGLAVTSKQRAESLPDVPTIDEAGIPGYELETWFGLVAPANTPQAVVDKLNDAIVKVIAMPDVQKSMRDSGLRPATSTPEEFAQKIRTDLAKFTDVVKKAGITVE